MRDVSNMFFINGKDTWLTWGLLLERGSFGQLLMPPKRKDTLSFSWMDEDGTDRDVSAYFKESRTLNLPCAILATSLADLQSKFSGFLEEVQKAGRFSLFINELGTSADFILNEVGELSFPYGTEGEYVIGKFNITIVDDLTDSTVIYGYLVTDEGDYITTDDGDLIIV